MSQEPERRRRARKTADQLTVELEADPDHQARIAAKEALRLARIARYREDEAPIVRDLEAAGFEVASVAELIGQQGIYQRAVPVLLTWLPLVTNTHVKESIVRALSVPFAGPHAAKALIDEFRRAEGGPLGLRWTIGTALEVVATDDVVDDMMTLASDRRYGRSREMVVMGLGNTTDARVLPVLLDLLQDDEVSGHAVAALGKAGPPSCKASIEPFLQHSRSWVRKEARRAIARIDKRAARRAAAT